MAKEMKRLSADIEQMAFEMVLEGKKLQEISKAMGLKGKTSLQYYLIKFPEFMELFERARQAECWAIEEEYRNIVNDYNPEYGKIQSDVLRRILMWRNPKVYGERQQIDMSMNIDISGSLDRANKRLIDVTTTAVVQVASRKDETDDGD